MEKKEVKISAPVTIAGMTMVTISKVSINGRHGKRGIAFSGSVQPDSVIITTPLEKVAFHISGEEVPLDRLTQQFPDISEKLEDI